MQRFRLFAKLMLEHFLRAKTYWISITIYVVLGYNLVRVSIKIDEYQLDEYVSRCMIIVVCMILTMVTAWVSMGKSKKTNAE